MKFDVSWVDTLPAKNRLLEPLRDRLLDSARNIRGGRLRLEDPYGRRVLGSEDSPSYEMKVRESMFYPRLLAGGSVALGETYAENWWDTDDLPGLLELLAYNREQFSGFSSYNPLSIVHFLIHWRNENTPSGARENIRDHYDLGNEFFRTFLDETMTYSSALFGDPSQPLGEAQRNKIDQTCRDLELNKAHHVLEIGSGWGSFALHAARQYGCTVTTTTLSDEQYRHVEEKVQDKGISDRVTVLKQDYRELTGEFDRIVSIEMIEAVGEQYLPEFFATLDERLAPYGKILLQGIHLLDQLHDAYRGNVDFIQRHIFPGGYLPSMRHLREILSGTKLRLRSVEEIGEDYVRTLNRWKKRFLNNRSSLEKLGFDEYFLRLWEYYFSYCEAGFRVEQVGVARMLLDRPEILGRTFR